MGHFYFIRHGESEWNVADKICGATDVPLTEKGHEQAVMTGKKFVEEGFTADEILCIDSEGGICMSGRPDEVFSDRRLSSLYGLEEGRLSRLYSGISAYKFKSHILSGIGIFNLIYGREEIYYGSGPYLGRILFGSVYHKSL